MGASDRPDAAKVWLANNEWDCADLADKELPVPAVDWMPTARIGDFGEGFRACPLTLTVRGNEGERVRWLQVAERSLPSEPYGISHGVALCHPDAVRPMLE
jgi:hypothetical protein